MIRENNNCNVKSELARADSTFTNVSKKRPFELNGIWIPEVQNSGSNCNSGTAISFSTVMLAADCT